MSWMKRDETRIFFRCSLDGLCSVGPDITGLWRRTLHPIEPWLANSSAKELMLLPTVAFPITFNLSINSQSSWILSFYFYLWVRGRTMLFSTQREQTVGSAEFLFPWDCPCRRYPHELVVNMAVGGLVPVWLALLPETTLLEYTVLSLGSVVIRALVSVGWNSDHWGFLQPSSVAHSEQTCFFGKTGAYSRNHSLCTPSTFGGFYMAPSILNAEVGPRAAMAELIPTSNSDVQQKAKSGTTKSFEMWLSACLEDVESCVESDRTNMQGVLTLIVSDAVWNQMETVRAQ